MSEQPAPEPPGESPTPSVDAAKRFWTAVQTPTITRRLVVAGVRRSGNHAIVNWLTNALACASTELHYPPPSLIGTTSDGRIAHANDLATHAESPYFDLADQQLELIARAHSLILSLEDRPVTTRFDRMLTGLFGDVPEPARVLVRRSTLNTLASRLQGLRRNSKRGITRSGLEITQYILDVMRSNRDAVPPNWIVIDFDSWLSDGALVRRGMLERLGLEHDIDPPISRAGNGSSFTDRQRVPTAGELTSRWATIDWPDDLVNQLLRPRNIGLLTESEVEFLLDVPTIG